MRRFSVQVVNAWTLAWGITATSSICSLFRPVKLLLDSTQAMAILCIWLIVCYTILSQNCASNSVPTFGLDCQWREQTKSPGFLSPLPSSIKLYIHVVLTFWFSTPNYHPSQVLLRNLSCLNIHVFCKYETPFVLMSASPANFMRSVPRNVSKLPSTLHTSWPSLCATKPIIVKSRHLATASPGPRSISDIWFTGSEPQLSVPSPNGQNPRKPPDERSVKLGKSIQYLLQFQAFH